MSANPDVTDLLAEIVESLRVISRLESRFVEFVSNKIENSHPGIEEAMVVSQYLANYYTALETIFLRISQYFENHLAPSAWHKELLHKMMLEIPGVRPRVISDTSHRDLGELLKFRHFTRYYFELDYDWDKLRFLIKKFKDLQSPLRKELEAFAAALEKADA